MIAASLAENTGSITFIDLDDNLISDRGAVELANGLKQNTGVKFLDLSGNQIGEDRNTAIAHCVHYRERSKCRFHCVWITGNKIDAHQLVACMVDSAFRYMSCSDAMSTYL